MCLPEHQQSRSVCSGNPVLCARKYGFVGCFGRCEQLLVATSSSFSKGAFQNDICRFESYMPSHAVRSLLCDFRVGENRRHSRGLGGRAAVSGQQIPKFPVWTSGFVAPVSAHHFPISVSARPRPVRYLTETGLQSCVSSVAVTRDVGMKSATSRRRQRQRLVTNDLNRRATLPEDNDRAESRIIGNADDELTRLRTHDHGEDGDPGNSRAGFPPAPDREYAAASCTARSLVRLRRTPPTSDLCTMSGD